MRLVVALRQFQATRHWTKTPVAACRDAEERGGLTSGKSGRDRPWGRSRFRALCGDHGRMAPFRRHLDSSRPLRGQRPSDPSNAPLAPFPGRDVAARRASVVWYPSGAKGCCVVEESLGLDAGPDSDASWIWRLKHPAARPTLIEVGSTEKYYCFISYIYLGRATCAPLCTAPARHPGKASPSFSRRSSMARPYAPSAGAAAGTLAARGPRQT